MATGSGSYRVILAAAALACGTGRVQPESASPALPPLAAATIVEADTTPASLPSPVSLTTDPLAALGPTRRVSVHSLNADVRTLLIAVAREAGLDLIVSGDVRARVSVELEDVPAADALRAIIQTAGLSISGPTAQATIAAITFYQLPINLNDASARTIRQRFGTTLELANFIVESRVETPKVP